MRTSRAQRVAALSAAVLAALAGKASGQVITWNNPVGGSWLTQGNWTPTTVPQLGTHTALFAPTGWVYTTDLGASTTVGVVDIQNPTTTLRLNGHTLTLSDPAGLTNGGLVFVQGTGNAIDGVITNNGAGAAGIHVNWGGSLTLGAGPLMNSGDIIVNPTGSNGSTWLRFGTDRTIDGPGRIVLGANTTRAALETADGATLTQSPGHTIEGGGNLAAALVNNGTVDATRPSALILMARDKVNNGVMRASAGSTLQVASVQIAQGPAGAFFADGGTVEFIGTAGVFGGVLDSANGGLVLHNGTTGMDAVTNLGAMDVNWGRSLTVSNGLQNEGVLRVNPSGSNGATTLHFVTSGDLDGSGELWLGAWDNRSQLTAEPGVTITHGVDHLIHGAGFVDAALINNGTVVADDASDALKLRVGPKVNNAAMIATGGGFLDLSTSLTQNGSGLLLADGGTVQLLNGTHITGGEVGTADGGLISVSGGTARLTDVLNTGALDVQWLTTLAIDGTGLTNDGVLRVNPGASNGVTTLRFDATGDLDGAGEIVLGAYTDRAQITAAKDVVVTHGADHTIRGSGQILAGLVNDGLISADGPSSPLVLGGSPKVNNNLMRADGHQLHIACAIDQGPLGRIIAEMGQVRLYTASITGGELGALEGASVELDAGDPATLTGVRTTGSFDVDWLATLNILGGLQNDGLIRVNPSVFNGATTLHFGESQHLGGNGEIRLNAWQDRSQITAATGATVTQGAGHTIRGSGQISAALVNDGTIEALGGNPLILLAEGKVNNAQMRAADDSSLHIGAAIEQGPGGSILTEGGEVRLFNGTTVSGGNLASTGDGRVTVDSGDTATLDGVAFSGSMLVEWLGTIAIGPSGLTNDGSIVINPTVSNGTTNLSIAADATLDGSGEVVLNAYTSRSRVIGQEGARLTNGPDHTIRGNGDIHSDLTNHGTLSPGKDGSPVGEFNLSGDVEQSATGGIELDLAGPALSQHDRLTGDAAISLDGELHVRLVPPYEPVLNTVFAAVTGASVEGEFGEVHFPTPLDTRLNWHITYTPTQVLLAVRCRSDFNGDGSMTAADFSAFRNAYLAGHPSADMNDDGMLSVGDFSAFRAAYLNGCL